MSLITVDQGELEEIKNRFDNIAERREEHNNNLIRLIDKLQNVRSGGFVEEIVEKLEEHVEDVTKHQLGNVEYTSEFLRLLIDEFETLDKNTKL